MNINVEKRRQLSVKLLHMKTSHNSKNPYTAILSDGTKKWTNTKGKKINGERKKYTVREKREKVVL